MEQPSTTGKLTRLEYILLLLLVAVVTAAATGFGVFYFQRAEPEDADGGYEAFLPDAEELPPGDYTLYFFSPREGILVAEVREAPAAPDLETRIRVALAELARGPETSGLVATVTSGLSLRAVYREPDRPLAYLDLAGPLAPREESTPLEAWAAVYSVVNTVVELGEEIDRVQFLRDGAPVEEPLGGWDLSAPLEPESAWIRADHMLP